MMTETPRGAEYLNKCLSVRYNSFFHSIFMFNGQELSVLQGISGIVQVHYKNMFVWSFMMCESLPVLCLCFCLQVWLSSSVWVSLFLFCWMEDLCWWSTAWNARQNKVHCTCLSNWLEDRSVWKPQVYINAFVCILMSNVSVSIVTGTYMMVAELNIILIVIKKNIDRVKLSVKRHLFNICIINFQHRIIR